MRPGYREAVPVSRAQVLLGIVATSLAILFLAGNVAARPAGCSAYRSQAAAQERFTDLGGGPSRNAEGLDGDRDGVACEHLRGPYEGFATVAYNLRRGFFYGVASMPPQRSGDGGFACLYGNRHFADGPRLLTLYRVTSRGDRAIAHEVGAEVRPGSGRLVWKVDKDLLAPGRYYVAFEEQQRLSPYGPAECPGFRSRQVRLPQTPPQAGS